MFENFIIAIIIGGLAFNWGYGYGTNEAKREYRESITHYENKIKSITKDEYNKGYANGYENGKYSILKRLSINDVRKLHNFPPKK